MELQEQVRLLADEVRALRRLCEKMQRRSEMSVRGLMSMQEVCRYYSVSRSYVQKLIADGKWPFAVKEAGKWRFPANEVERYFGHL